MVPRMQTTERTAPRWSRARIPAAAAGVICLSIATFAVWLPSAQAATVVDLGAADSFVVLGASTVTNTGPSVLNGDLGVAPGSAITGFPPGIVVGGATHDNDAVAQQAQIDATSAYNTAAGQPSDFDITADLGGQTLVAGAYTAETSAQLTGALTLDGQNNSDSVWLFQIGSTLTTATDSSIVLINEAQACNVFWQVGSSATLGTSTDFVGTILALASVTLVTDTTMDGRALALTGAVTLDSNVFVDPACDIDVDADADADVVVDADTDVVDADTDVVDADVTDADTDVVDVDVVDADTDVVDADTDVVDADTDAVDVDTDVVEEEERDLDTDAVNLDTDTGDVDTDLVDTDTTDVDNDADAGAATPLPGTRNTALPATGFDGLWLIPAATMLLLTGVVLVLVRRRHTGR